MNSINIDQQFHGYRRGHQLLSSSCRLSRVDQDVLTYLSDLSGPLEPGQTFPPYLTGYPLPSGDYYVLAKTWQDLDVERSGCVYTRSFLIEMSDWLAIKHLRSLMEDLGSNQKATLSDHKHRFLDQQRFIEPIDDPRSVLLAKAIFLKDQFPIAWFGSAKSEPIVTRLLQSNKSALRRGFSFCTFSLAPRSIDGTPLSLQFAPQASRSRFAQWTGQKIGNDYEVVSLDKEPELKALVESIFIAKEPDISSIDKSKLFWNNDGEQAAPINIVMLWNRMLREAIDSPSALLGLLDISSTLGYLAPSALEKLKPIVHGWLVKRSGDFSDEEIVDFLSSLFAKIRETNAELWSDLPLRGAVSSAVRRAPTFAIQKLTPNLERSNWVFNLVMSSIGDGLSHLDSTDLSSILKENFPKDHIFDLMLTNHEISQLIADSDVLDGVDTATSFESFFGALIQKDAAKFSRDVFAMLWKKEHVPLLKALANTLDQNSMMTGIPDMFQNGRPIASEFDGVLLSNKSVIAALPKLQKIILETGKTTEVDRFITASIVAQPATLQMLLKLDERSSDRLRLIIELLLQDHSAKVLRNLFEYKENNIFAARIAERLVAADPKVAVSLLSHITAPSYQAVDAAFKCYGTGEKRTAERAAFQSVRFALQLDISSAGQILNSIGAISLDEQQASSLCFVQEGYSPEVIERNLRYMAESWQGTSSEFPFGGNHIFSSLISYGLENFSSTLWTSLGMILEEISSKNQYEGEVGAGHLLGAALRLTDADVSGLLEVTFPVVHKALKRDRREPSVFSPFYYTDWDKCKTARTELVRAYIRSSWPEESLLSIAVKIHEAYSIFDIINLQYGGEDFMKELVKSVDRLPKSVRKSLEKQLS